MNLVKTLGKVAMGIMISRGIGKMMGRGQTGGGGLGGLLGGLLSGSQGAGGLGGMLGSVLSGGRAQPQAPDQASFGSGGLGGLLNGLNDDSTAQQGGSIGEMLNRTFGGESTPEPTPDQNQQAELILRGMINAAKSDGEIDESEQQKILEHLGDVTEDEVQFVRREMAAPLDVDGFVRSVPRGMEQQVYLMSLLSIDLDSQAEARYLDQLAQGLNISHERSNQIHTKLGVPTLYG